MNEIMTVHSPDPQTPEMQMQTEIEHLKDKVYNLTRERDELLRIVGKIAARTGYDACPYCNHYLPDSEESDCELIEYDAEEDEFDGECKFDWVGVREG